MMIRAMLGALVVAMSLTAGVVRVLQTNAAGDNIHVIDPATNKVVGMIEDIEVPHGITIAPDGSRIYVTNESLTTLDVVDAKTLKVFKRTKRFANGRVSDRLEIMLRRQDRSETFLQKREQLVLLVIRLIVDRQIQLTFETRQDHVLQNLVVGISIPVPSLTLARFWRQQHQEPRFSLHAKEIHVYAGHQLMPDVAVHVVTGRK